MPRRAATIKPPPVDPPPVDPLLTLDQAREELRVPESTFRNWRANGKGPRCIRLPSGELRIRRSAFDAWLRSLEEKVDAA
jgi:hypothetical protein